MEMLDVLSMVYDNIIPIKNSRYVIAELEGNYGLVDGSNGDVIIQFKYNKLNRAGIAVIFIDTESDSSKVLVLKTFHIVDINSSDIATRLVGKLKFIYTVDYLLIVDKTDGKIYLSSSYRYMNFGLEETVLEIGDKKLRLVGDRLYTEEEYRKEFFVAVYKTTAGEVYLDKSGKYHLYINKLKMRVAYTQACHNRLAKLADSGEVIWINGT